MNYSCLPSLNCTLDDTELVDWNQTYLESDQPVLTDDIENHTKLLADSRFWIQRVVLPLLVAVGVFGNSITIIVLSRKRMRSSTNCYLTALAISDFLYLVFMFSLSLQHYPAVKDGILPFYWQFWRFGVWLTDASSNTSVWLTVTFTIERYIAVCHPMMGRAMCTESRANKAILAVYLSCFLLALPTPFEHTVIETFDPIQNTTRVHLSISELGKNQTYRTIFYWLTVVLFTFLPLMLLAIFNSFLIHNVRQSRIERKAMTMRDHPSQETKITTMLIAVVILFMLCQLPTAIMLIYTSLNDHSPRGSSDEAILLILGNIFNLLMVINAAANFILYCALSDRYRRTFLLTFCSCCGPQFSPTHSSLATDASPGHYFTRSFSSLRSKSSRFEQRKSHLSRPPARALTMRYNRPVETKANNDIKANSHSPKSEEYKKLLSFIKYTDPKVTKAPSVEDNNSVVKTVDVTVV